MLDNLNISLFFIASVALITAPGPDTIYVVARSISQGIKAGILSAIGVCTGLLFHLTSVTLGLSLLLLASNTAYFVIKFAGMAYLIYLGIRTITNKQSFTAPSATKKSTKPAIFVQGVISNVLNPKVALFFLAFLPQFIGENSELWTLQILTLGFIFIFLGLIWLIIIALLAGNFGIWVNTNKRLSDVLRWISGSVLIGLGLKLAFSGKK